MASFFFRAAEDMGLMRRLILAASLLQLAQLGCGNSAPGAVSKPTACTFGGSDLATLFVTTTREGLAADAEPLAGSLFAVRPGVTGQPARTFRRAFGPASPRVANVTGPTA